MVVGLVGAGALSTAMAVAALAAGSGDSAPAQAILCPSPVSAVQALTIPDSARAEVDRELANLDKQIAEANERLKNSVGQGGPNFVQNAILGPLKSKRVAALDRIAIAIGRKGVAPQGLDRFATCSLGQPGDQAPGPAPITSAPATSAAAGQPQGPQPVGRIACPDPVIPVAVPAAARAEVDRELSNLDKQIAEANERLKNSVGQGGPNFVQNAILGPLKSKREAALNRIETAIGRVAAKPEGLERFATCSVN
ncbi:hypothetical protein [Saccharothrix sp.]|uniref:hypothetical protein n=1 Tax=Saccharothrix sp. TaxID=1873460 RepID=UPI002812108A|nr:hypothetical protein [Saccharothrix sp.]